MPSFERPSLPEIIRRDTSDFEHEQGVQAARLPGTPEHAFVRAHAGVAHGLHGRIDRVRRDAFLATCSDEAAIQKARMYGVFAIPATFSTGVITLGGEADIIVPIGTVFVRGDGALYITTASAESSPEGVALCPARAMASGPDGNMVQGTKLALREPVADMDNTGQVGELAGWQNGEPAETTASLRLRLQQRLENPPKGGGPGDYIRWALGDDDGEDKVPEGVTPPAGITRAWEYGKVPKVGNVTVLVMTDGEDDPFPGPEKLEEVKNWIMYFAPTALPPVIVMAPNPKVLDLEIELTIEANADVEEVKAAITQSIRDMIALRAVPPKDNAQKFYKSWISEAISTTPGELDHKVNVPTSDVPLAKWDLVTLGTITWAA